MYDPEDDLAAGFSSYTSYTGLPPYEGGPTDPRRVSVGGLGQNGTPAYNTAGHTVRQDSHLNTYPGAVGYTPSHGHIPPASGAYREQDLHARSRPSFPAQNISPEAPAGNPYYYDPRTNYPRQRPMTMQPPVEEAAYGANDYLPRNRPSQSNSVQNMGVVNARISRPTTPPHFEQTVDPRMLFRGSAGPTGSFPDSGVGQHSVQISSAVGGHRSRSKKDIGTAPQHPYVQQAGQGSTAGRRTPAPGPAEPAEASLERCPHCDGTRGPFVRGHVSGRRVCHACYRHELKHGVHRPLKTAERQQKRILGGGKR